MLVVEDGPTITHGGMPSGAGFIAAKQAGAGTIIDPRPYLTKSLKTTFKKYPHIGVLLPAMGYGSAQIKELQTTINKCPADVVLAGTPIDLSRLIKLDPGKTMVRVRYEYKDVGSPTIESLLKKF